MSDIKGGSKRGKVFSDKDFNEALDQHMTCDGPSYSRDVVTHLIGLIDKTDLRTWDSIYVFLKWLNEEREDVFRAIAKDLMAVPRDWNTSRDQLLHIAAPYLERMELENIEREEAK